MPARQGDNKKTALLRLSKRAVFQQSVGAGSKPALQQTQLPIYTGFVNYRAGLEPALTKTLFHRQHKIIRRQILKARQFDFHFGGGQIAVEVQFYNC